MTCLRKGVCTSPWLAEFALARLSYPGLGIVGFSEGAHIRDACGRCCCLGLGTLVLHMLQAGIPRVTWVRIDLLWEGFVVTGPSASGAMFLTAPSWCSLGTTATIREKFGEAKIGPASGVALRCKKKAPEI